MAGGWCIRGDGWGRTVFFSLLLLLLLLSMIGISLDSGEG